MKILIITTYFPPQNSVASLRPYSWAKHWSRSGHDVTVLTTKKFEHPTDTVYPYAGFAVREVEVPSFGLLRGVFGKKNVEKHAGSKNSLISLGMRAFNKLIQRLQGRYGILNACRLPDLTDLWVLPAFQAVSNERWDLVVSTAWPYTVHHVAYKLRKKGMTKKWIADWRDLWTENHLFPGLWPFTIIERIYENLWMRKADFITTVSEPLAAVLKRKFGSKVSVIYNGFDPDDYEDLPLERAYPQDKALRIIYTGSIYPGKQDPSALFQAVSRLHDEGSITPDQLQIIFYGNNSDMSLLAGRFKIVDYVKYGGFLPRQNVLWFQRDADALLFLEFDSKIVQGILTGKLFEYLFSGPPILSVGIGADESADVLLKETGRGGAFGNDVDLVAQKIGQLIETKKKDSGLKHSIGAFQNDEIIIRYSRQRQAERLLSLLENKSIT